MTDFQHSIVLFSGDDGLPLEFNVRNTNDKAILKALIEHGGGMCTQNKDAVHLISPGTKVLNVDPGKILVSTRYIHACVSQNYLLDVNGYVLTTSESQTSDISDEDSGRLISNREVSITNCNNNRKEINNVKGDFSATHTNMECSIVSVSTPLKDSCVQKDSTTSSTQSESFVEGSQDVSSNLRLSSAMLCADTHIRKCRPLTSTAQEPDAMEDLKNLNNIEIDLSPIKGLESLASPAKTPYTIPCYKQEDDNVDVVPLSEQTSRIHTISSSQLQMDDFDPFDNVILNKAQQKTHLDDEECLSQNYRVSSLADARGSSRPNSGDIFAGPSNAQPDSQIQIESQTIDHYTYIKELEVEVERILQKPLKSLQDKICLVKYICCVKKLPPATVLQSLHTL